ncbi:MAG: M48 family metalloprotease [Phycisphaerales bacterium]|nr:MAG: M48 family metalloprotease [Phycisphaerales bacterium]
MVKRFTWLVAGLTLGLVSGCAVNPLTGQEELMFFSEDKDVQLGEKYAPQIEQALGGRFPDENLQDYINTVGQRIARFCHRPDIAYHFTAVDEKQVNAFAVPGGYIFITKGLLEKLDCEAQLAAILGHEIGHVVARDTMAALSRQIGMTALLGAAASVGGSGSGDLMAGTAFVSGVLSLQYSRDDEKAADMVGMAYLVQAGYDPRAAVETMRILQELQSVRPVEFFSTHPNPQNRVAYLEERIERRYGMIGELKMGREDYEQNVLAVLAEHKSPRRPPDGVTTEVEGHEPASSLETGS